MANVNKNVDVEINLTIEEIKILEKARDILEREWESIWEQDEDTAWDEYCYILTAKEHISKLVD